MEYTREAYLQLKGVIKSLASEQVSLKNQRKTVNRVGEKVLEPWQAQMKHQTNRYELFHLYVAYDLLRGKETKYLGYDNNYVNKILDKYEKVVCVES